MNNYTIQTKDETRAQLWRYLFGVDALPVLSNRAEELEGSHYAAMMKELELLRQIAALDWRVVE